MAEWKISNEIHCYDLEWQGSWPRVDRVQGGSSGMGVDFHLLAWGAALDELLNRKSAERPIKVALKEGCGAKNSRVTMGRVVMKEFDEFGSGMVPVRDEGSTLVQKEVARSGPIRDRVWFHCTDCLKSVLGVRVCLLEAENRLQG